MNGKPWSPDEVKVLTDMHRDGLGYTQIAKRLGRSRWAVNAKVKKLKLPPTECRWVTAADRRAAVLDLIKKGLLQKDAATRIGISRSMVSFIVQEFIREGIVKSTGRAQTRAYTVTPKWNSR